MAKYLVTVSYTHDGAKGLRQDGGTKRHHVVREAVEGFGGTLESFYFCMGDKDAILIADVPDAIAAAGLSVAVAASGGARCSSVPLLTPDEMDKACSKKTAYKAPGL